MLCAIPIETTNRELDGALYQALHLAARGLPTLLGGRMVDRIVDRADGPVVYFNNDHFTSLAPKIREQGGCVVNVHPEGINLVDSEHVSGLAAKAAVEADVWCGWGTAQADLVRSLVPADRASRVLATGHPSFDLARPEFIPFYEQREIVSRYGRGYTLINTNFGYVNHMMGLDRYIDMVSQSIDIFKDRDHLESVKALAEYQRALLGPFIELARGLAERFPDRYVIIRPHPVESTGVYERACKGLPNVAVSKRGSVREWIASAGAVVHHDCTTGIESVMMGKPTVQFRPVFDAGIASHIASLAGLPETSLASALAVVGGTGWTGAALKAQLSALAPYFANLEHNASAFLADLAADRAGGAASWEPVPLGLLQDVRSWRKYLSKRLRALQFGHNGRKVRHALAKFSRLPMAEVEHRLARLRAVEPLLPEVDLERLCLDTFLVRPKAS